MLVLFICFVKYIIKSDLKYLSVKDSSLCLKYHPSLISVLVRVNCPYTSEIPQPGEGENYLELYLSPSITMLPRLLAVK